MRAGPSIFVSAVVAMALVFITPVAAQTASGSANGTMSSSANPSASGSHMKSHARRRHRKVQSSDNKATRPAGSGPTSGR